MLDPPVNDPVTAAVAELSAVLDRAAEVPTWVPSDEALSAAVAACATAVTRAQALLVGLVGEIDARGIGTRRGAVSTAAWLRHVLNAMPREARTLVGVATAIRGGITVTGAAFGAGDVSLAQAVVIPGALGELPDELPSDIRQRAERELVGYADRFDAQQLTRLGSHILTVVAPEIGEARDAEALERQEQQARRRRELFFTPDGHGTVHLRGRLTDEAAAIVRAALDPLAAPLPRTVAGTDQRTAGQRRADALVELCRRGLRSGDVPESGGEPTQVVVTIPLRTLTEGLGITRLPDGAPLSAAKARRMACDCQLIPAVLGAEGAVLDVGRAQRLFGGALRRALILRDRGCAFPGCDRPASWCDGHHIVTVAQSGPTSLGNGVLLCSYHHDVVHRETGRSG